MIRESFKSLGVHYDITVQSSDKSRMTSIYIGIDKPYKWISRCYRLKDGGAAQEKAVIELKQNIIFGLVDYSNIEKALDLLMRGSEELIESNSDITFIPLSVGLKASLGVFSLKSISAASIKPMTFYEVVMLGQELFLSPNNGWSYTPIGYIHDDMIILYDKFFGKFIPIGNTKSYVLQEIKEYLALTEKMLGSIPISVFRKVLGRHEDYLGIKAVANQNGDVISPDTSQLLVDP